MPTKRAVPIWPDPTESTAARDARLEHERVLLAEGDRDLAEGRFIADADVDAWLDRLTEDETVPSPAPRAARR